MRHAHGLAMALVALTAGGCGGGQKLHQPPPTAPDTVRVLSPVLAGGGKLGRAYTCDGEGVAPPVEWNGVPREAREVAVVVSDPDAPGGTFVHWTVFGIPPSAEGLSPAKLPAGAKEGQNSAGKTGWTPACPPKGDPSHHYDFDVYWLRRRSGLAAGAKPEDVIAVVKRDAGGRGRLEVHYARAG